MYDVDRVKRLKAILDRHRPVNKTADTDVRPSSGMVGQSCEGYVPVQSSTRLVRVAVRPLNEDDLGPGYYEAFMPTGMNAASVNCHDRNTDPANYAVKPGPCEYPHQPRETQMIHDLKPTAPYPVTPPPLGGSLVHNSWMPQPPTFIPQATHPQVKFRPTMSSRMFLSKLGRELWSPPPLAPSPVIHTAQGKFGPEESWEQSSAFKSRIDRFAIPGPFPPPCTAYSLPDRFGESNTRIMRQPYEMQPLPKEVTPGPPQYAAPIVTPPDVSHQSPEFLEVFDRFADPAFKTPSPDAYSIDRDITKGTSKPVVKKRTDWPAVEWDYTAAKYNPPSGAYDCRPKWGEGSAYISTIGHRPYDEKEDRPLAFRTLHSSMIRKSHNSHYLDATHR
jgi:hypothetical protein